MPKGTYEPIKTYTFASTGTTLSWTSIPQTYTDLVLTGHLRNTTGNNYEAYVTFNGASGTAYNQSFLVNYNGALQSGYNNNIGQIRPFKSGATYWATGQMNIFNYSSTDVFKHAMCRNGEGTFTVMNLTGQWRSTAAINQIDITIEAGASFTAGTKFDLYGIKAE